MTRKIGFIMAVLLSAVLYPGSQAFCRDKDDPSSSPGTALVSLVKAHMCEDVTGHEPRNRAVVFSVGMGRVFCYTAFDSVPETTSVYHNWFRREKLSTRIRLALKSPRWSTYSSIQLREADKGPWRVEIIDEKGRFLDVLRFSITD